MHGYTGPPLQPWGQKLKHEGSEGLRDSHLKSDPPAGICEPDLGSNGDIIFGLTVVGLAGRVVAKGGPNDNDAMMGKMGQLLVWGSRLPTYTIQVGLDVAVGINGGFFASQLVDAADDGDIATNVPVEIGRGDARGRLRIHSWSCCGLNKAFKCLDLRINWIRKE